MKRLRLAISACSVSLMIVSPITADDEPRAAQISLASDEGQKAIARFQIPKEFKLELVAAEPLLANPVAFDVDEKGRLYVAETFRLHEGVTDNRGHMYWLDDDLAARTVADRVAMYKKHLPPDEAAKYAGSEDRVRRLVDSNGDGVYDQATIFAGGFDDMSDGLGSGLLARGNTVWYTCIPNLWKLIDADNDGVAEIKESLSTGYGVHVAFLGHDLHGLIMGPDGRLYFSVGDRGLNVRNKEGKQLTSFAMGAVLRCDPDGRNLEIIARGLRNPQELAFDPYGNLFTVDNNSDGGDRARLVDVLEGGDSGWRMGYQYLEVPVLRGPWNAESLWKPRSEGNEAAYLLPPLINVSDGPSGLVRDSGTGLPPRYRDHFFLADFRGTAANSGIRTFALDPDGATFRMVDQHQFLWSILATDVDLAPGGGLLVSDWVEGWRMPGKGRIYKVSDPALDNGQTAAQVASILSKGMSRLSIDVLGTLLAHADFRVRLEAQFELASRAGAGSRDSGTASEAFAALNYATQHASNLFPRIHGVWGFWQLLRNGDTSAVTPLVARLKDPDGRVRAQAARALGESGRGDLSIELIPLLRDPDPRTRLITATALGKLGDPRSIDALAELLKENNNADAYLRHGAVMGLLGSAGPGALVRLAEDPAPAVRLGALLVQRRRGDASIAQLLNDHAPQIVLEAARAISDESISDALPQLAALDPKAELGEPILRRIVAANEKVGGDLAANRLATIALNDLLPTSIRSEAISVLSDWPKPSGRDRIVGLWRPIEVRSAEPAAAAIRSNVTKLLAAPQGAIREATLKAIGRLGLQDQSELLLGVVRAGKEESGSKVEALRSLNALKAPNLAEAVELGVRDTNSRVRSEALRLLASLDPERALPLLVEVLSKGETRERQAALGALGDMKPGQGDAAIAEWLDRLIAGEVATELRLDLLEAAQKRDSADVKRRLEVYEDSKSKDSPLAAYSESLAGGDARSGAGIFFGRTSAQCLKCHKVRGQGGEVGPDLTGIGSKKDRNYLLRSIVEPNGEIAQGFDTLVVATADGRVISGILKDSPANVLRLMDAEGKMIEIPKSEVDEQTRGASAMPMDLLKNLSKRDIRDLVEFLSTLK
jgi:quinoprotein glucose dehydrogenase